MAEWRTLSAGSDKIKSVKKYKIIHYLNELNTMTGLQNMGCHQDIIKH